jgi:hypothetical protein
VAVHYDSTPERLSIRQTRRGLRIAMWGFALFGLLGLVLVNIPHKDGAKVTCDRAGHACSIEHRSRTDKISLAEIQSVELTESALLLDRVAGEPYHVCTNTRASLQVTADQLSSFLANPAMQTVTASCVSEGGGVPIGGRIAGVGGMLLLFVLMGAYLLETEVVIDHKARTITMRGFRWPRRRWSFERPLAEVKGVVVRTLYVGRGNRQPVVYVTFEDADPVIAFAPGAFRPAVLDQRITELREAIRGAGALDARADR